ncbi:hypothetical protein FNYG_05519 [Fusarium nygamai]|uniref:NACHT domain-containing protein n=1 Tax=Gibberella nygamai TaxID=42673 RepID=A0A2K0WFK9_GIBNY|nr:hypothetical protein FNYG_05519 [Fusarium nygamai]
MPPRWFEKVESKAKKLLSPSAPSPLPSSIASEPASESAARRIPQPTPSLTTSTDTQTSPLPSLQEQLWNQAYDELKANQPKLVEAYEKILSVRLHRNDLSSITYVSTENEIEGARETRCRQMQQLVRDGLDRTQIAASIKRGIDEGLQAVQAVRGIVDKAIKAAPEAAIAWVGVCVGLEILSNPITEARCNRDGIAYVLARMEWYWNLVSLLLDDNKAEQSSAGLRDQLEKHVVQLYEKLLSYQVKSVCLYHRNWAAVALKDVLRLDDWAGQLDDIQKAEAVVRTDADQYNTEKSKIYLQKLIDTASTLEMNLQSIHSAIKYQTRQQDKRYQDAKYEKCMQDLHVTDPRKDKKRIQDTKGGLLRDSYRWILDHADFRRFRDDPQSRLLWVKGDPGKGKTMLLCGIINELEKESGCLLSYFFCQATEAQLSNAASVLRGLIYLLILQRPSLISHVRSKHDVTGEKLFQGINIWVSLVEIFTDMLNDPALKDGVLVIDALDECIIDRPQLLDFICQSSSASSSRVKWIISSRNWPEIEEKLDGAKHKVSLHLELNMDRISEAVNTYIEYKMDQLAHDKKYDAETRQSVADYLTSNADGTFLWVALVCQKLALPKARARNASATVREFPPSLNSLYMRMMEYIHDLEGRDSDRCKKILASASLVYRPVNFDELRVLVESAEDLNDNDLEEIIALCGSFLIVRHRIIYFVHQSAKDFLLINASEQILPSGISQQHHVLFSRSSHHRSGFVTQP